MSETFKEVIVVEGNHYKARIHERFSEADVVITNGSEVPRETLDMLKHLNRQRGLILLLDPDGPGEKIRRLITDYVGNTKHVFIERRHCIDEKKKKVGIEHAELDVIETALLRYVMSNKAETFVTKQDLYDRRLIGFKDAKKRREHLCRSLHIGMANGKTLLKKLNMFGIELEILDEVIS